MSVHSILSPSSAHRWTACPGSIEAQRNKKDTAGAAAQEGTAAHELLEMCIISDTKPESYMGHQFMPGFPVNENMCDAVNVALDYIQSFLDVDPDLELFTEQRLEIGERIGLERGVYAGTVDLVLINRKAHKLYVFDYKHGANVIVDVENNEQLLSYVAGVLNKHWDEFEPEEIVMSVIQPRARGGDKIKEKTYKRTEVIKWLESIREPALLALDPTAPRAAGDHCQFCKADKSCAERADWVLNKGFRAALGDFAHLINPMETKPIEFVKRLPVKGDMTEEQLGIAMEQGAVLSKWFTDVKAEALERAQAGKVIPGWSLQPGTSKREWADEADARKWLVERLDPKDIEVKSLISAPQAEKVLREKGLLEKKVTIQTIAGKVVELKEGNKVLKQDKEITDFDDIV